MGTLASNPTAVAAFDAQIHKKGLDLTRSIIPRDLGTEVVDPAASIRPGQLVTRTALGYIAGATGADVYGIAKWGSAPFGVGVIVDQAVVLNGTTVTNLKVNNVARGNVSNVTVRSAPNMAGTVYIAGTDYTLVAGAGTIARIALAGITDGQTVYVSFTYALVDADFDFDGRYWQNQPANRTAFQEGRITVITDWSRIFTVEWVTGDGLANDANSTYALTGANSKLYCSAEGKFSNASGTDFVGRVYQLPTAADPYMGVTAGGNPTP